MKFLNLNVEDVFESNKLHDVYQIFSEKLWKEPDSIYITNVLAPLDIGGRLPLDPREKEGFVHR